MNRRDFLIYAGSFTLFQLLTGCGQPQDSTTYIRFLKESIPSQLLGQFRREIPANLSINFAQTEQLEQLFKLLQLWQQRSTPSAQTSRRISLPFFAPRVPPVPDLVTLGDYWLRKAIQQQLIEPLPLERVSTWESLSPRWHQLAQRDKAGLPDNSGKLWGAPYRWGTTLIAYNRNQFDRLDWQPQDWPDLWKRELRGHLSLLDQPREIIGLTLKMLGKSYNEPNPEQVPELKEKLVALNRQAKFYSSQAYLQPLVLGDTWAAVGWSDDLIPLVQRHKHLEAVVPATGTALWADLWVRPARLSNQQTDAEEAAWQRWIEFCWKPQIAEQISSLTNAVSPILTQADTEDLPKASRQALLPSEETLERSEFLQPLPESAIAQYRSLWQAIRQPSN